MFTRRVNHGLMWGVFLVSGLYVLYEIATKFKAKGVDSGYALQNAGIFPRVLAIFIVLAAIVGIGFILREKYIQGKEKDTTPGDVVPFDRYCFIVLGLLLAYVLSLDILGYYIGSIAFMTLCLIALRGASTQSPPLIVLLLTSIIISTLIVVSFGWVFESLLGFVLPLGMWELTLS